MKTTNKIIYNLSEEDVKEALLIYICDENNQQYKIEDLNFTLKYRIKNDYTQYGESERVFDGFRVETKEKENS